MANEVLITVDGVEMPCPSKYEWSLQDVSAGESGRTDDSLMWKNRVAQKRKLVLSWVGKSPEEVAQIMQAFNPEYFSVKYWDALDNRYETRTFYAGDRTAPIQFWWSGKRMFESVSFDIIER